MAHLLRARPRPHPARQRLPPPGRQDPGVRLPRRPPAHPAHPRPRGRPGGHGGRPRPSASTWPSPRPSPSATTAGTARAATPARTRCRPTSTGGYDHAVWGADVVLAPLNLCAETLDGIRNHSWSPPGAGHARGRGGVVGRPHRLRLPRLRGRRVAAGIVTPGDAARRRSRSAAAAAAARQLGAFIDGDGRRRPRPPAGSAWRAADGRGARRLPAVQLRAHLPAPGVGGARPKRSSPCCRRWSSTTPTGPNLLPADRQGGLEAGSAEALRAAVTYVGGMTDRFACQQAVALLGWDPASSRAAASTRRPRELASRPMTACGRSRRSRRAGSVERGRDRQASVASATSTSLRPLRSPNFTLPSTRANSVSSPPRPTLLAGVEAGAALAHDDRAGGDGGAVEHLHAEALGVGVAAVAGGAAALGLRHLEPPSALGAIPVISTVV